MAFNDISREIWKQMSSGLVSNNDEPFINDFFVPSNDSGIDFRKLLQFISDEVRTSATDFYWKNFVNYPPRDTGFNVLQLVGPYFNPPNISFTYKDEQGQTIKSKVSGRLNKRKGKIEGWGYRFEMNPDVGLGEVKASLQVFYTETVEERKSATETPIDNDFRLKDKFVAIELTTTDLADIHYLVKAIASSEALKKLDEDIVDQLVEKLRHSWDGKEINFFYECIPDFAIPAISGQMDKGFVIKQLGELKDYDDSSWFVDSSGGIVKLLRVLSSGNANYLYEIFKDRPLLVKELYYNMHHDSSMSGALQSNRSIFSSLMYMLCMQNGNKDLKITGHVYRIGKYFFPDSNISKDNDAIVDKIFLRQYKTKIITKSYSRTAHESLNMGTNELVDEEVDFPINGGHYYHPFDIVMLVDMDSKDRTPYPVPAIFIKSLADEKEWEDINYYIRIGADILAIIIGIASLGTASPLLLAVAMIDIGLSATDMAIALHEDELSKTSEGREFLEYWNKIALVGGVLAASPLLLQKGFSTGARLLPKVAGTGTKNFLQACLLKMILEVNIVNFTKGSVKVLDSAEVVYKESKQLFKITQVSELQKAGVVFLRVEGKTSGKVTEKGFAVFYEGEMIAYGNAKRVRTALKTILGLKGKELIANLESFAKLVKADPVMLLWGAGKESHPRLWKETIRDLISKGVEIKYGKNNLAYGPNPSGGAPGTITISENASITALLHEAQHFYDDLLLGFPGWEKTVYDPVTRWKMEYKAYMKEIEFLRENKEFDIANKLLNNANAEKKLIEQDFNIKL